MPLPVPRSTTKGVGGRMEERKEVSAGRESVSRTRKESSEGS